MLLQYVMWEVIKKDIQCQCLASTRTGIYISTYTHEPPHMQTCLHICSYSIRTRTYQEWDPLFFLASESELAATWGPVGGKLHESESDSVLELTSPLHRSRLAWKATLPGKRNWHSIEIDEIFKHFSISWTLAFGKNSFNKRPAWPMQMCPRVSFFYGLYRSQGLQWRGQVSVAKSLSGDQVLSGIFIAHLSRQLLFQLLAVSAG